MAESRRNHDEPLNREYWQWRGGIDARLQVLEGAAMEYKRYFADIQAQLQAQGNLLYREQRELRSDLNMWRDKFHEENQRALRGLAEKVDDLQKWRWQIMGGALALSTIVPIAMKLLLK